MANFKKGTVEINQAGQNVHPEYDFGLISRVPSLNFSSTPGDIIEISKRLSEFFMRNFDSANIIDALNKLEQNDRKLVTALILRVCFGHTKSETDFQIDCEILDGEPDFGNAFVEALKNLLKQEFQPRRDDSQENLNEAQNELLSQPFTIWHAVSRFGDSQGQASWLVVKFVISFLSAHGISCPWMRGDDLGVFGETPLHVALLCNEPVPEVEQMFIFLWKHCERIRERQYSAPKYEGENVLHLAIVRNYTMEFLEELRKLHLARWEHLFEARAIGTFFNDREEGCHMLGELPLFFAACYDRTDIFEYLVKTGAKLKVVTSKGDNLLHVMIERENVVSGTAASRSDAGVALSMREMLDCVLTTLHSKDDSEGQPVYQYLSTQRGAKKLTPIMLAAAEGSLQVFEYFFEVANVEVAWVYGSVECVKIRLNGSDPAFSDSESDAEGESLLELLVRHKRRDILTESIISQIIDRKWQKYGNAIFCARLFLSVLYASAVVSIPVFQWVSVRTTVHVFAMFILDQITHPQSFKESLLFKFVYHPLNDEKIDFWSRKFVVSLLNDVVTWVFWQVSFSKSQRQALVQTKESGPASLSALSIPLLSLGILKASFLIFFCCAFIGQPLDTYFVWNGLPLLHYLQTGLYTSSGIFAFCTVISSLIVFDAYGSLVFMLINTLRRDLPMFGVAYLMFLTCFAYYHFLASNHLHAGLLDQGLDSVWRIFSAMVGQFDDEDPTICRYTTTRVVVMGISVANYFFVTVVLVNLLIAFLTNTIEKISNEARMEWRLQRARILLEEDSRISAQQMNKMAFLMSKSGVRKSQKSSRGSNALSSSQETSSEAKSASISEPQERFFFVKRMRETESCLGEYDVHPIHDGPGKTPSTPKYTPLTPRNPAKKSIRRKSTMQALAAGEIGRGAVPNQESSAIRFLEDWASDAGAHTESDYRVRQRDIESEVSPLGSGEGLCTSLDPTQAGQIFRMVYAVCFPLLQESSVKELPHRFLGSDSDPREKFEINQYKGRVIEFIKAEQRNQYLLNEESNRNPISDSDFDQLSIERIRRNSVRYTIWNAVSSFRTKEGQLSWQVVKAVIKILESSDVNCPWMRGDERGVFGETPLHLALLCNEPDDRDFLEMFTCLWDTCPCLRKLEYKSSHYQGENILHLAVVRGFKTEFLERIHLSHPQTDVWDTLVRSRAVGKFFVDPRHGIAPLGELPLFFAACVNRPDAFEFLARHNQELLLETTNHKGNNLLHVLILKEKAGGLWSSGSADSQSRLRDKTLTKVHKILKGIRLESLPGQGLRSPLPGAGNAASASEAQITTVFEALMCGENADGLTPLALAATSGSCTMFRHLFDDETSIAWVYGPVTCTKLYLDGVDVDLPGCKTNSQGANGSGLMAERTASTLMANKPILELLAENNRSDILSSSCIDKLVDIKWHKYGEKIFVRKLLLSLLIAGLTFVLPMIQADTPVLWKIAHTLCHLVVAFCTYNEHKLGQRESALFRLIFGYPEIKGFGQSVFAFRDFLIELLCFIPEGAMSMFDYLGTVIEAVRSCRKLFECTKDDEQPPVLLPHSKIMRSKSTLAPGNPMAAQRPAGDSEIWAGITKAAPPVSFLLLCSFSFHAWVLAYWSPVYLPKGLAGGVLHGLAEAAAVTAHITETSLYALVGLVAFWNFVSLVVAIDQEYGLYIQMLLNITSRDLPAFFAVYALVLLAFSYCHFLASNSVASGVGEAMDSVWGIFIAMIGQFHGDITKAAGGSPFQLVVTGISVVNYFLVTVVLVNLLIAQISNTFKETSAAARGLRKLRRAKIMVEIDRTMSAEQRRDKKYWYLGSDNRRLGAVPPCSL